MGAPANGIRAPRAIIRNRTARAPGQAFDRNQPEGQMTQSKNFLKSVGQWVKDEIAQDVPEESALCEFDCRKDQCTHEEWESCERRLRAAAGELMPPDGVALEPAGAGNPSREKRSLLPS
jgi:hypothetical protein